MAYLDLLAPELVVAAGAMVVLLMGVATRRSWRDAAAGLALLVLLGAFALAIRTAPDGQWLGGVRIGWLAWITRLVGLAVSALLLLVAWHLPASRQRGEFFAMLMFSTLGVLLVGAADDLLLLFLALELVSVPTYVLVVMGRNHLRAEEAGVKYFFLGAMAAAMTVYGFSFLYGICGSTSLAHVSAAVAQRGLSDPLVIVGLTLSVAGMAFKIAAVPLHFYAADVYQGAAAPVTGMLGFLPKMAGMIALIKLVALSGWPLEGAPFWLLWVVAAATMTVGNVLALLQRNVKRMLAYSSIAHSGYMLIGLLVGPLGGEPMRDGVTAMLFYISVYAVMNLGAFAVLAYLKVRGQEAEDLDDIAGLSQRDGVAALILAVCVFGLMGMPPTGGFLAKVYVFGSALATDRPAMIALAVIAVINSAIAAAYYLRIVGACYLARPVGEVSSEPAFSLKVGLALCGLLVLALGLGPQNLMRCVSQASRDLRPVGSYQHPALVQNVDQRDLADAHKKGDGPAGLSVRRLTTRP